MLESCERNRATRRCHNRGWGNDISIVVPKRFITKVGDSEARGAVAGDQRNVGGDGRRDRVQASGVRYTLADALGDEACSKDLHWLRVSSSSFEKLRVGRGISGHLQVGRSGQERPQ
eukprot:2778804-Rhodomonas_salina.2